VHVLVSRVAMAANRHSVQERGHLSVLLNGSDDYPHVLRISCGRAT
jgi:hypothetical protein